MTHCVEIKSNQTGFCIQLCNLVVQVQEVRLPTKGRTLGFSLKEMRGQPFR